MKTLVLALFLSALSVQAQTISVKFYGSETNAETYGIPYYWPAQVQPGTIAGFVLMTQAQLDGIIATNQAAYTAWESNKTYVAKAALDANLARLVVLFNQIPAARTQMTNIQNSTIGNVAAASTAIKTQANVINGILEELQRLGPVLKQIYKPDEDTTP